MSAKTVALTILPSESRADTTTQDYANDQFKGIELYVDQTAQGSTTAFVSVKLQGRIPGTTKYYTVGTISPATAATFQRRLRVYPGATTALDSTGVVATSVNEYLPAIWRVATTNVSTSAVTFSVSANLYP